MLWLAVACCLFTAVHSRTLLPPVYNPGCDAQNDTLVCSNSTFNSTSNDANNLFLTESRSTQDKLFFIWSTIGGPTLLFLQTSAEATVSVDWEAMPTLPAPVVSVDGQLLASAGYTLKSVWNCTGDDLSAVRVKIPVDPVDCQRLSNIDLSNLQWDNTSHTIAAIDGDTGYTFFLRSQDPILLGGMISIQVTIYNHAGRDEVLLPLLYNQNSTQFEIKLVDLPGADNVRYSLEHSYAYPTTGDPFSFKNTRYLDDEYTPGIFSFSEVDAREEQSENVNKFYLGWKTAGYSDASLNLNSLIPLSTSGMATLDVALGTIGSLVSEFYLGRAEKYTCVNFNMSFGENDLDGGYQGLLAWTGQFGLGAASYDTLSATVLSITIVGILTPIVLIVVGGVGVFFLKKRRAGQYVLEVATANDDFNYREIINDD